MLIDSYIEHLSKYEFDLASADKGKLGSLEVLAKQPYAAKQKRLAEKKAAKQKRLAEKKAAEEKRLAAEKAVEQKRLAAEKEANLLATAKSAGFDSIKDYEAEQKRIAAKKKDYDHLVSMFRLYIMIKEEYSRHKDQTYQNVSSQQIDEAKKSIKVIQNEINKKNNIDTDKAWNDGVLAYEKMIKPMKKYIGLSPITGMSQQKWVLLVGMLTQISDKISGNKDNIKKDF